MRQFQVGRSMLDDRRAFTLIELLVVIAIISLLISVLVPTLNKAKILARRIGCLSNLHHVGVGNEFYVSDYDEWLPGRAEWWSTLTYYYGWTNEGWLRGCDYLADHKVFYCPAAHVPPDAQTGEQCYDTNYWFLQDSYAPTRVPSGRGIVWTSSADDTWWYNRDSVSDYPVVTDYCFGRHGYVGGFYHGPDGLNVLYGGMHAEWLSNASFYEIILADVNNGDGDYGLQGPRQVWQAMADQ